MTINVLNVKYSNAVDVNARNDCLARGEIDRDELWPRIVEFEARPCTFRFSFGLDELPEDPGVILIRGPRQYGKSTWLELALRETIEAYGPGSAYILNGDELTDADDLEGNIVDLIPMFASGAPVRRLFIDEITALPQWEVAVKRLADRGVLRDVLLVTTGSRATDIRRGSERLPGRKGKLARTDYLFCGVAYKDFYTQFHRELGEDTWIAYLLSGGSPVAASEIWQFERIPAYFFEMIRDWVIGEMARSGRSRQFLIALMRTLFVQGGSRTGYLKLARESGLANNTVASGYIEQLSDALAVLPSYQWDHNKDMPQQRKPAKFHFVNLSVALAFAPNRIASVHEFKQLPPAEKGRWVEWLVAQELFRRQAIAGIDDPETIWYWASKEHEIDFVDHARRLYEVKVGGTGPRDFAWFPRTFPDRELVVIGGNEFETQQVKGLTVEQFLLADGLPHPYPGEVDTS